MLTDPSGQVSHRKISSSPWPKWNAGPGTPNCTEDTILQRDFSFLRQPQADAWHGHHVPARTSLGVLKKIPMMAKMHLMKVSHTTKPLKVGLEFEGECIIVCVSDIRLR